MCLGVLVVAVFVLLLFSFVALLVCRQQFRMCAGVRKSCSCYCMWFVMLVALAPICLVQNGCILDVVVAVGCGCVLMIGDVVVDDK